MSCEQESAAGRLEIERQRDLAFIEANRDFFWLVAAAAGEQTDRGLLVVDLTRYEAEKSLFFGYMPEGALEYLDERQQELLQIYNPQREFIISLYKSGGRVRTYLEQMPEMGWWEELSPQTPYPSSDPDLPSA